MFFSFSIDVLKIPNTIIYYKQQECIENIQNISFNNISKIENNLIEIDKCKKKYPASYILYLLLKIFKYILVLYLPFIITNYIFRKDTFRKKFKRYSIPKNIKNEVWNRDSGKCTQCGSNQKLEFDHIIPVSKGGANTYRNIQLLCESCNRSKSAKIG